MRVKNIKGKEIVLFYVMSSFSAMLFYVGISKPIKKESLYSFTSIRT
jgi:hypothetical protein